MILMIEVLAIRCWLIHSSLQSTATGVNGAAGATVQCLVEQEPNVGPEPAPTLHHLTVVPRARDLATKKSRASSRLSAPGKQWWRTGTRGVSVQLCVEEELKGGREDHVLERSVQRMRSKSGIVTPWTVPGRRGNVFDLEL